MMVGGLVPADALVLGDAARFRVAVPLRVPVLADERVRDAVARERVLLVGHGRGRDERVHGLLEDLAFVFESPRTEPLHVVGLVVLERAHAQDPVVLDVDPRDVASGAEAAPVYVVIDRLVGTYAFLHHVLLQSIVRTAEPLREGDGPFPPAAFADAAIVGSAFGPGAPPGRIGRTARASLKFWAENLKNGGGTACGPRVAHGFRVANGSRVARGPQVARGSQVAHGSRVAGCPGTIGPRAVRDPEREASPKPHASCRDEGVPRAAVTPAARSRFLLRAPVWGAPARAPRARYAVTLLRVPR